MSIMSIMSIMSALLAVFGIFWGMLAGLTVCGLAVEWIGARLEDYYGYYRVRRSRSLSGSHAKR